MNRLLLSLYNFRQIAVFRLDCTHGSDSVEEFEQKKELAKQLP
jgi:hypothetical protein